MFSPATSSHSTRQPISAKRGTTGRPVATSKLGQLCGVYQFVNNNLSPAQLHTMTVSLLHSQEHIRTILRLPADDQARFIDRADQVHVSIFSWYHPLIAF